MKDPDSAYIWQENLFVNISSSIITLTKLTTFVISVTFSVLTCTISIKYVLNIYETSLT